MSDTEKNSAGPAASAEFQTTDLALDHETLKDLNAPESANDVRGGVAGTGIQCLLTVVYTKQASVNCGGAQ